MRSSIDACAQQVRSSRPMVLSTLLSRCGGHQDCLRIATEWPRTAARPGPASSVLPLALGGAWGRRSAAGRWIDYSRRVRGHPQVKPCERRSFHRSWLHPRASFVGTCNAHLDHQGAPRFPSCRPRRLCRVRLRSVERPTSIARYGATVASIARKSGPNSCRTGIGAAGTAGSLWWDDGVKKD